MKAVKLFAILMVLGFTGCVTIDYKDFKPVYYVINQSDQTIDLVYTLRQEIAEQGFKQTDTIEINVCDTAAIEMLGPLEMERECRPSAMFSNIKFVTKSGKVIKEMSSINDKEWTDFNIAKGRYMDLWAYGWLYEFKEE